MSISSSGQRGSLAILRVATSPPAWQGATRFQLEVSGGPDPIGAVERAAELLNARLTAGRYGQCTHSQHQLYLWFSRSTRLAREAMSAICLEGLEQASIRPRGLRFLGWERQTGEERVARTVDKLALLVGRRADPTFGARFAGLLEHDRAFASLRQPDLIGELHLELSPREEWLVRQTLIGRPDRPVWLDPLGLAFELSTIQTLAAGLAKRDWLERVAPAPNGLHAVTVHAGPKARRISEPETVEIR